jgi:hypothetical protein
MQRLWARVLVVGLLVAEPAYATQPATAAAARPAPPRAFVPGTQVPYQTHNQTQELLHAYPGERVVLLLPRPIALRDAQKITKQLDRCAEVYIDLALRPWPQVSLPQFQGLASVAVVQETCGAGCGAGGKAEIKYTEFQAAVAGIGDLTSALTWQVGLYELGRGGQAGKSPTWPFGPALDPAERQDVIGSAMPELVMNICLDKLGWPAAAVQKSVQTKGYPRHRTAVQHRLQIVEAGLPFADALAQDRPGYYRGWALSGLLYDVYVQLGQPALRQLLQALVLRAQSQGQAKDTPAVAANLRWAAGQRRGPALLRYLTSVWKL